ncbi:AMD1 [Cordylochernes scorpioides]|uniref:AMD1 n=1 Tax=Cordylochernes scorpioides TaxID=51811 RepID=A0ABY6KID7_9ARAC|nr:AMD1 [Cordylochernes scorpioides]
MIIMCLFCPRCCSESSMFISKNRFILKTCGTTTLLKALSPLLLVVQTITGFDKVMDIFYTRKNFMRPELQDFLHKSFENELCLLKKLFPQGSAYRLGQNNQDCWYMFTLNPVPKYRAGITVPDQTMEISFLGLSVIFFKITCTQISFFFKIQWVHVIMHELDPAVMSIFTQLESTSAEEASRKSGISTLFQDMIIDDYLFEPCGYSMNGLLKGGYYLTIHVTPEPHCSYVSFETNFPQENYDELMRRVVALFKPGKFLATVLANKASVAREKQLVHEPTGFQCKEHQLCQFENYTLNYALYTKFPS